MQSRAKLVETAELSKRYPGILALNAVDFDLEPGEVHVLFGENGAGKSTLISMLAGASQPSSGRIYLDGEEVYFASVAEAQRRGIYTVFQEFSLIPTMTAAQNIFLGREPMRGPFIDHLAMRQRSQEMFDKLGFPVCPTDMVAHLSRAQQQMVEIAKAFHGNFSVLILDEPTASLTDREVDHLFAFIGGLKERGVGIIYISHRMHEFARIADRITVLRDGAKIGTVAMADTSEDTLLEMMTGRAITEIYPDIARQEGEVLLEAVGVSTPGIHECSLVIRAGEILGVAGLAGSGKSRLFRMLMGLAPCLGGKVVFRGEDISHARTRDLIRSGIFYLSPDRKTEGLDLARTSGDNLSLNLVMGGCGVSRLGMIDGEAVRVASDRISDHVELHEGYRQKLVSQLSGGNQQKILFGKCFGQDADIYIFDEPTVGVDIGTRSALYLLIKELAESGKAVVVISSDLPEVMHLSHRMIVLAHGKITGELAGEDMNEEQILKYFFDESGAKTWMKTEPKHG